MTVVHEVLRLRAAGLLAIVLCGCGSGPAYDVAIGAFDGGKMIALNKWIGTNTNQVWTDLDAYADVPDQTPGILDINGPQHWRCTGIFTKQTNPPGSSGFFESDQQQRQDKALTLPKMAGGFAGPHGTYLIAIEVPSLTAKFSHTWTFGETAYPSATPYDVYDNLAACTPIADTLAQQRSIGDQYLSALQTQVNHATASPIRTQLQVLLDQAHKAKASGDGQVEPNQRATDYQSAVGKLNAMAQAAAAITPSWDGSRWVPLARGDIAGIEKFAANASAVLSETGLG